MASVCFVRPEKRHRQDQGPRQSSQASPAKEKPPLECSSTLWSHSGAFDVLPDSLILSILSNLPKAEDIACFGSTCTRLQHVTKAVPSLHFSNKRLSLRKSKFELVVSNHVSKTTNLQNLKVVSQNSIASSSLLFWLECSKNTLQTLCIKESLEASDLDWRLWRLSKLPELQSLALSTLSSGSFQRLGAGFREGCSKFKNLLMLRIDWLDTTDSILEELVRCCPNLLDLSLYSIKGLDSPSIRAPKLKSFVLEQAVRKERYSSRRINDLRISLETPLLQKMALVLVSKVHFFEKCPELHSLELVNCANLELTGDVNLSLVDRLGLRSVEKLKFKAAW
jgi:hypothetical protein